MIARKVLKWVDSKYFNEHCLELYDLDLLPFNLTSLLRYDPKKKSDVIGLINSKIQSNPKFWDYRHNNIIKEGESWEDVDFKIFTDFLSKHPEHKDLKRKVPLKGKYVDK